MKKFFRFPPIPKTQITKRSFTSLETRGINREFTHVGNNNLPQMVDVSSKTTTFRTAKARSVLLLPKELTNLLENGEIQSAKGPVFATAIIAGTMGVKKTSDLIPFCHPLAIEKCNFTIDFQKEINEITIDCEVKITGKTGVEMEALTGCSIASLCVYDMCKAISHEIVIKDTRLISKSGGKSDLNYK